VLHHYRLNNLAVIIDVNHQQCDGAMDSVLKLGSAASKLRAFGAQVIELDGHDIEAIAKAGAVTPKAKPLVILARTNPSQGMDYLEQRRPKLHYVRFASVEEAEELAAAIGQQWRAAGS
jgi:transketolase